MDSKTRLKNLRERYGLSIRSLSERIDISYANMSKIERGLTSLTMKTIAEYTKFYQVTTDYILGKESNGFIISSYDDEGNTYCDMVTEGELDSYIDNKEIEESIGAKHINRIITSKKLAEEIKKKYYFDPKTKTLRSIGNGSPPLDEKKKAFIDDLFYYYDGLDEEQKELIKAMVKSLAKKKQEK